MIEKLSKVHVEFDGTVIGFIGGKLMLTPGDGIEGCYVIDSRHATVTRRPLTVGDYVPCERLIDLPTGTVVSMTFALSDETHYYIRTSATSDSYDYHGWYSATLCRHVNPIPGGATIAYLPGADK